MLNNRFLEAATTKYIVATIFLLLFSVIGVFYFLLKTDVVSLDKLVPFVDAVFKAMAILLGTIWTLNRYYVKRTDTVQLRVESDVDIIRNPDSSSENKDLALLIFRLDVLNIGAVLIPTYQQRLIIHSVVPTKSGNKYDPLYQWPVSGKYEGGPIEPGTWSAINDAVTVPTNIQAIRVYLEIEFMEGKGWDWHKTFDVSEKKTDGK